MAWFHKFVVSWIRSHLPSHLISLYNIREMLSALEFFWEGNSALCQFAINHRVNLPSLPSWVHKFAWQPATITMDDETTLGWQPPQLVTTISYRCVFLRLIPRSRPNKSVRRCGNFKPFSLCKASLKSLEGNYMKLQHNIWYTPNSGVDANSDHSVNNLGL